MLRAELKIGLKERLTKTLLDDYFVGKVFYDVSNRDTRISNVSERLTEKVEALTESLVTALDSGLRPAAEVVGYLAALFTSYGPLAGGSVLL